MAHSHSRLESWQTVVVTTSSASGFWSSLLLYSQSSAWFRLVVFCQAILSHIVLRVCHHTREVALVIMEQFTSLPGGGYGLNSNSDTAEVLTE